MRENRLKESVVVLVLSLLVLVSFQSAKGQDKKWTEPETIGVFYFLDSSSGDLRQLERQIATSKIRGLIKGQAVAEIKGERASLRITTDQKVEFVVSLPTGVDPNKYQLISFSVKKGKREAVLVEGTMTGSKTNPVMVSYNVTKFGNSSYKYTPAQALPVGEYGFSPNDSNDVFCFAVDQSKEGTKNY